ncbi:MAG TPA: hypothetical protein PKJ43_09680, partial [Prolixibacteraceae bacterium]|nr:hypothetical protein [Prolixibacteraceae bacterium]
DPENYEANGKLCIIKEVTTIKETFDIMKSVVPMLDTIFYISDNLKSGSLLMKEAEDIVLTKFMGITIKFITCIDNKTLGERCRVSTIQAVFFAHLLASTATGNLLINSKLHKLLENMQKHLFSRVIMPLEPMAISGGT